MYSRKIFEFAQRIAKRYRTSNPFELAEMLGIRISYKHFGSLKGMYFVVDRCAFITLSDTLDETMEKIVLFHEIGHHLLHRHLASKAFQEFGLYDMSSKPEMEANIFAANMLIDDYELDSLARENYTTSQIASMLYVPHQMLLIKMQDMNTRGYDYNLDYEPRADFLGR